MWSTNHKQSAVDNSILFVRNEWKMKRRRQKPKWTKDIDEKTTSKPINMWLTRRRNNNSIIFNNIKEKIVEMVVDSAKWKSVHKYRRRKREKEKKNLFCQLTHDLNMPPITSNGFFFLLLLCVDEKKKTETHVKMMLHTCVWIRLDESTSHKTIRQLIASIIRIWMRMWHISVGRYVFHITCRLQWFGRFSSALPCFI